MKFITLLFVLLTSAAFAGETTTVGTTGETVEAAQAPAPAPSAAPKKKHHHHKKPTPAPAPSASPAAQK